MISCYLTIVFTDIVGSTAATEKLGDSIFLKLKALHDDLFKATMCRNGEGIIIKEIGDSFLCVFAEPSTAVMRSLDFQREIHKNREALSNSGYTLSVKIGIHVGQVAFENSFKPDVFGKHVNRTARLVSLASSNLIVASLSVYENAIGWLKDFKDYGIEWKYYGKTVVKGISEKIEVYGFFLSENGTPALPKVFARQKLIKSIIIVLAVIVFGCFVYMVRQQYSGMTKLRAEAAKASQKKTYYIQFNFSDTIASVKAQSNDRRIDLEELKEKLQSQFVSLMYPDSVITEEDLFVQMAKKGLPQKRLDPIEDGSFLYDSLQTQGNFFIYLKEISLRSDSILCTIRSSIRGTTSVTTRSVSSWGDYVFANQELEIDFRNDIQKILLDFRLSERQASVIEIKGNTIVFHKEPGSALKQGSVIAFKRIYTESKELQLDFQKRIDYLNAHHPDSALINREVESREGWIKSFELGTQSVLENVYAKAKVLQVFDSTGTAALFNNKIFLEEKPRPGDQIYLYY